MFLAIPISFIYKTNWCGSPSISTLSSLELKLFFYSMGLFWFLAIPILYLFLLYSLFASTVTSCFPFVQHAQCHEDESSALLQFKQSFVINKSTSESCVSYPKTSSWIRSIDCCSWDGVECDGKTGQVIGLDLGNSQLYGSIGPDSTLVHLLQLQSLNLSHNHFNYSQICNNPYFIDVGKRVTILYLIGLP